MKNLYIIPYWSLFSFTLCPLLLAETFSLFVSPVKNHERPSSTKWFSCPSTHQEERSVSNYWVTNEELDRISHETRIQKKELVTVLADVVYYDASLEPSIYRINPHRDDEMKLTQIQSCNNLLASMRTSDDYILQKVEKVTSLTFNWCSDFVQRLNLCPWAKLSLQSKNSIKIHILSQSMGLESMENLVRKAALELIELTDRGKVDENSGITFVVAIHDEDAELGVQGTEFDFETFYNFCTELEDRFLNEDGVDFRERGVSIGDEVIIAPFHPEWRWHSFDTQEITQQNMDGRDDPLNFEKKSPFPTISIVRSRVVFDAGEETTRRIGIHNEKILSEMGSKTLEEFYQRNVLGEISGDTHEIQN